MKLPTFDYSGIKAWVVSFLKKEWLNWLAKKILGTATYGGVQGWLVAKFGEQIYKRALAPTVKWLFRKAHREYNEYEGEKQTERVDDAKTKEEYNDSINDIFE